MTTIQHRAVLFDLFGTLVPCYPRAAVQSAIRAMAHDLGLVAETFEAEWTRTFPLRRRRELTSVEANIRSVLDGLGHGARHDQVVAATRRRLDFEAATLSPRAGVLETLAALRSRGVRLAIVSNCAIETAEVWTSSPLHRSVDHIVLSCMSGTEKPDAAIYLGAASALGVAPSECLFVGDGSSDELMGAKRVGMKPVLVRCADDDDSFPDRVARGDWQGAFISEISQVTKFLEPITP
jgi:putative hydrolase of the HAD superfamily